MDLKEKNCIYCGKLFKPTVPLNKYCSSECSKMANKKPKVEFKIRCAICGKEVIAHKKSTLYCGYECRMKARYKRISLARKENKGND